MDKLQAAVLGPILASMAGDTQEAERQAADVANNENKAERFHTQNDLRAIILQRKWEHCGGWNYL
jgi:hypothetical protein